VRGGHRHGSRSSFLATWSFRSPVIVLFAVASIAIYRMRLRRLTKELNIGFEERLGERTRIAQELHDTLLQGLLATSMQLHVTWIVYRTTRLRAPACAPATMLRQ